MILQPHVTRCPACGRFVYATDALFVAENWKGVEKIRGFVPGIYHEACFRDSPHREAYLAIDRAIRNAELDQADEYLVVLGRTSKLALTLRPVTGDYQLWFLGLARMLRLRGDERWREFLARVAGDHPVPTTAGDRGDLRLRQTRDGWELATRQSVPISLELAVADFDRLRDYLTARGADPARKPVALGTICAELGIVPISTGCPLERLAGTFNWSETPTDLGSTVTIMVQVETWHSISLTDAEFEELRQFLRGLNGAGK
jgi:hypothetical protein